jgi:hypothetical protein
MNRYQSQFPQRHALLPVVDVEYPAQAIRCAEIAFKEGADGIVLSNPNLSSESLRICYEGVRKRFPDRWIGLNCIDCTAVRAIERMEHGMNGLWLDYPGIYDDKDRTAREAGKIANAHKEREENWCSFLLFGDVSFKFQSGISNVQRAAELAVPYLDVITTGDRNGSPPALDKVKLVRVGAGRSPIAIVGRLTSENVEPYLEFADCFLVTFGAGNSPHPFTARRIRKLVQAIGR